MSLTLQEFLASATIKAASSLETALLHLPEDRLLWKPTDSARSALDQVAECALMNAATITMIQEHAFPSDYSDTVYREQIDALCADWPALRQQLHENAAKVATVIRAVPDADLTRLFELPWETVSLSEVLSYPYWNMSYHEGQINYIASQLGCLA